MPVFWMERIAVSRPEPRALDDDVDLAQTVLHGLAGCLLGGHLRRERGGLARALEPTLPADAHEMTLPSGR
jgi:hypothetical protein